MERVLLVVVVCRCQYDVVSINVVVVIVFAVVGAQLAAHRCRVKVVHATHTRAAVLHFAPKLQITAPTLHQQHITHTYKHTHILA